MEPFTVSLLVGAATLAIDFWKERKQKRAGQLADPPEFSDKQIDKFTNAVDHVRRFDPDVAANILRPHLRNRSVHPIQHPDLTELGKVWAVVPLTPGYMRASEIVERAHRSGRSVLGSLSLVLMPNGSHEPMVLIVGAPQIERYTMHPPGGLFAVLTPPEVITAAAEAAPPKHQNGVTAPAEPAPPDTERPAANGQSAAE